MKRKITSIVALTLVICLLPFSVFATSVQPRKEFSVTMWLVAYEGGGVLSSFVDAVRYGHAFLAFENESTMSVKIGHMTVQPEDFVTIGNFGNRSSHYGIWYNIEAYNLPGSDTDLYSLPYYLTEAELATVNSVINSSDYYTFYDHNCAHFAKNVWNSVVRSPKISTPILGIMYPEIICLDIEEYDSTPFNYTIQRKPISKIAYHSATGVVYETLGAWPHS